MARKYPDRRVRVLTYRGWDEIWHLTLAQAEAVYDAMIALNDVSGRVQATIPIGDGADLRVFEKESGEVHVVLVAEHIAQKWRVYDDQHAFAVAHGLEDK
ncbi:MAG: hypothetical protein RBU21_02880 [FCB group bacterium]|nr:hypothetical protein [FCB group bacterium]